MHGEFFSCVCAKIASAQSASSPAQPPAAVHVHLALGQSPVMELRAATVYRYLYTFRTCVCSVYGCYTCLLYMYTYVYATANSQPATQIAKQLFDGRRGPTTYLAALAADV